MLASYNEELLAHAAYSPHLASWSDPKQGIIKQVLELVFKVKQAFNELEKVYAIDESDDLSVRVIKQLISEFWLSDAMGTLSQSLVRTIIDWQSLAKYKLAAGFPNTRMYYLLRFVDVIKREKENLVTIGSK